jgi:hypothetical protein
MTLPFLVVFMVLTEDLSDLGGGVGVVYSVGAV